jgi:hypothetical protein
MGLDRRTGHVAVGQLHLDVSAPDHPPSVTEAVLEEPRVRRASLGSREDADELRSLVVLGAADRAARYGRWAISDTERRRKIRELPRWDQLPSRTSLPAGFIPVSSAEAT